MDITDSSPSPSPSLELQSDALQKGLGRAVLWALAGRLAYDPLIDACLQDKRYDKQCENNRGEWLWTIINLMKATEPLRKPVLESLRSVMTAADAPQLCQLAFHYAAGGDSEFEHALYDFVERKPIGEEPSIGEDQLLELGGEKALQFIARIRGSLLSRREWTWDDSAIVSRAIEKLSGERVAELLDGTSDLDVGRFAAGWRQEQSQRPGAERQANTEQMRANSVSDVIEAAYGEGTGSWFRRWGRVADECDLETVIHVLRYAHDPKLIAKLLEVFCKRPLPRFGSWLIDLCRHNNEAVRHRAFMALKMNTHSLIREFAVSELQNSGFDGRAIALLAKNYIKGDERMLLDIVELPEDCFVRHRLLTDILDVLVENRESDCSQLGLVCYFHNPCEICRYYAGKTLLERQAAPNWLLDEFKHDSYAESRRIAHAVA